MTIEPTAIPTAGLELVQRELGGIREFYETRMNSEIPPLREELERIGHQVAKLQTARRQSEKLALLDQHAAPRPRVPFGKYAGLDHLDLACVRSLLAAQVREPAGASPRMLDDWQSNLKAAMDSTTAGQGDELVDTQEARALWDDVNLETAIAPLFNTVQMPSNPFRIPLQLGDVNWYPGVENTAAAATALTTARQTLTAHELVAEVPWSYDLDEDAVIAMMDELRRSLLRNAHEVIDDVILNGDTTTTNNINADGATIAAATAGAGHYLIGFDGLLHLPLVDHTAMGNNHNAAVSADLFNEIRGKLGKYGARPSDLAYITDVNTFIKSLSIDSFRTLDKFGPHATLLTGQLGAVEGIPVIVSEQMRTADADGKITSGGSANTKGRLLIVNRSQWRVGFKRELTIETVRDAQKRQNIMVVSFRIALQERSGARASATHTALQYNITGV